MSIKNQMQNPKTTLSPSRSALISLPLTLIYDLHEAADTLGLHRTDIIRRSFMRDVYSVLRNEVTPMKQRLPANEGG
jgi:hypothetical protein